MSKITRQQVTEAMKFLYGLPLLAAMIAGPAIAEDKTLSNATLNDKGYERLDGASQFRPGCRYLIRSEDKTTIYRPSVIRGRSISFTHIGIAYRVPAEDKSRLLGTDGSVTRVTTWRSCAVL